MDHHLADYRSAHGGQVQVVTYLNCPHPPPSHHVVTFGLERNRRCTGPPEGQPHYRVSKCFSRFSSQVRPVPTRSDGIANPPSICMGSSTKASAQSTYSSQWAPGVAHSSCALISGIRWDEISTSAAAAIPAACIHPVTPPIRATSGITKSQAAAAGGWL